MAHQSGVLDSIARKMGAEDLPDMPPANTEQWVFEIIRETEPEKQIERESNMARLAQLAKGK